jgi:hypothetical protein
VTLASCESAFEIEEEPLSPPLREVGAPFCLAVEKEKTELVGKAEAVFQKNNYNNKVSAYHRSPRKRRLLFQLTVEDGGSGILAAEAPLLRRGSPRMLHNSLALLSANVSFRPSRQQLHAHGLEANSSALATLNVPPSAG